MANAIHPANQFRSIVETKASDFLQTMMGTESGANAAGQVALAFRQAAQTNDRLYSCDPASVALQNWQHATVYGFAQRQCSKPMSFEL